MIFPLVIKEIGPPKTLPQGQDKTKLESLTLINLNNYKLMNNTLYTIQD